MTAGKKRAIAAPLFNGDGRHESEPLPDACMANA